MQVITKSLGEITKYISKGIVPVYADNEDKNIIKVLNQKCNRDFFISYDKARFHNLLKKRVPKDRILQKNDVLINSTGVGTAGRVAQIIEIDCPVTFDGHMILLRPKSEIDSLFFGYAIKNQQSVIESMAEGSTGQTEINRQRLINEIFISFPEKLQDQQKIARILRVLDDKIELNTRINQNLEEQAKAIFKSWFIDFEPFGGVQPADWKNGCLSDLVTIRYGKDHKKLTSGIYPLYGTGGIIRYVDRSLYVQESVLIPRKGTLNNVIYVDQPFWSIDTMFYTEMRIPNVAKYIYHFLLNINLPSLNTGTAVPSMTTNVLYSLGLVIPTQEILEKFENVIAPLYMNHSSNKKQTEKLSLIRDTLLPKLMSGEINVSELDL